MALVTSECIPPALIAVYVILPEPLTVFWTLLKSWTTMSLYYLLNFILWLNTWFLRYS